MSDSIYVRQVVPNYLDDFSSDTPNVSLAAHNYEYMYNPEGELANTDKMGIDGTIYPTFIGDFAVDATHSNQYEVDSIIHHLESKYSEQIKCI